MSLFLPACATAGRDNGTDPVGPPPAWAELREAYNDRADKLDRLWAQTVVRVRTIDDQGRRREDQGEGYLQIIRPDRVSLSLGKLVDRMYFFLGSNEEWYWWLDTLDRDEQFAIVGRHELASREKAAELGVPVHPLDLLELIGITPLPQEGPEPVWSADGRLEVALPGRWGTRRLLIDPLEMRPLAIELRSEDGALAARAELDSYTTVRSDGPGANPSIPRRIFIDLPQIDAEVTLDVSRPQSVRSRPRDIAFDLDELLDRQRIERIRLLDEPREP